MAMSRMMIALSCLAALTFVSNASLSSKFVIYTLICTIGRIDWSDITFAKTASKALSDVETESDAVEPSPAPLHVDVSILESATMDNGDARDMDAAIRCLPALETAPQETKHRSRASSMSTASLFDKPTHPNERPSTPDTEIGDIPEFSTLASKYQDHPVAVSTECLTEPDAATTVPDVQLPPAPAPSLVDTSKPATKYSMKPTELVHAIEDFSFELPIPQPTASTTASNKRSLDETLQQESEPNIASPEGNKTDDDLLVSAVKTLEQSPQSTVTKKRKLNSRQRRQRALRLAGGAVSPSPSPLSQAV
ncbi:hypothetical protein B0T14DRAFT_274462 [Immersiella caudata]|uniref:Uncharacterized protein n=1 Tax=Immersiella caudata TaxID=314043 RepID=A0AA40BXZ1_9PEZI|nr:hypothetical protein B0T14DRAFT_274462 [Immersiella caudata]